MFRSFLLMSREIQENRRDITKTSSDLEQLEERVRDLARQLQEERHRREKLELKLENTLMRFERRLPPGRGASEQ
ncbi:MAG: hypothetical protein FD161_3520 [Limisphaerales bacterium]|nr:MAG: hypothetical protein FD161_3520 [Limisphaerales bacterium]KAG0507653.1 MAG: hypothetical protein E1N63_3186 [Limisphaerales bacterium]TXT51772.1 MAG: hypothetical protein FD140_1413 [Limisphaerales bacterium]